MPSTTIAGTVDCALKREPPVIDLQRQRRAGEDRGQADDRQREIADLHQLLAEPARIIGRREAADQRAKGEQRHPADQRQAVDRRSGRSARNRCDPQPGDPRHVHRR